MDERNEKRKRENKKENSQQPPLSMHTYLYDNCKCSTPVNLSQIWLYLVYLGQEQDDDDVLLRVLSPSVPRFLLWYGHTIPNCIKLTAHTQGKSGTPAVNCQCPPSLPSPVFPLFIVSCSINLLLMYVYYKHMYILVFRYGAYHCHLPQIKMNIDSVKKRRGQITERKKTHIGVSLNGMKHWL